MIASPLKDCIIILVVTLLLATVLLSMQVSSGIALQKRPSAYNSTVMFKVFETMEDLSHEYLPVLSYAREMLDLVIEVPLNLWHIVWRMSEHVFMHRITRPLTSLKNNVTLVLYNEIKCCILMPLGEVLWDALLK